MIQPKNETETHFLLKEISKYILWSWGYNRIATEVHNMYDLDISKQWRTKNKGLKSIIDTVGIKKCHKFIPYEGHQHWYDVRGIEAKASLSDFKNGFCAAPAHTYIISPKGIIPVDLVPDKIGLIEVDFNIFELKKSTNKVESIKGIEVVKKSKRRIDRRFSDVEHYKKWCLEMLDTVSYRCSHELLFWRNCIEFTKEQEVM